MFTTSLSDSKNRSLSLFYCLREKQHTLAVFDFWATICKTFRPMLSDRSLSCLSVLPVCLSCL